MPECVTKIVFSFLAAVRRIACALKLSPLPPCRPSLCRPDCLLAKPGGPCRSAEQIDSKDESEDEL
jgi:hypothetical protein